MQNATWCAIRGDLREMPPSRDGLVPISRESRIAVMWAVALYGAVVSTVAILSKSSHAMLAAVFLLYLSVLFLPVVAPRFGTGWFHPLVFHSFWTFVRWVLPKTGVYAGALEFHPALPDYGPDELSSLVTYGLMLETLALAATYTGFLLVRSRPPRVRIEFSGSRFLVPGMLVAVLSSFAAFLVLTRHTGGLEGLLLQRGLRRDVRVGAVLGGQWYVVVEFLSIACLVWAGLRQDALRRPAFWGLFLGGLALKFAATGSRSGVVFPIVLCIIIWSIHHRRLPYVRVFAVALLGLISVGVLGQFRTATFTAASLDEIQLSVSVRDSLSRGVSTLVRYATTAHSFYPIIARVPAEVDLLYGSSYLTMLSAPIPRALWPEKPIAPGALASRVFYNDPYNAIPTGSVGEAYWNFHIPGVIMVFLLWGMCLKLLLNFWNYRVLGDGTLPFYVLALHYFQPNTDSFYGLLHSLIPALFFLCLYSGPPRLRLFRTVAERSRLAR